MRRIIFILMLLLIFAGAIEAAHYKGNDIQYESINGRTYKIVYMMNDDELIIHYFDEGGIPQGKWQLVGVEIFKAGEKIKDTFSKND